MRKPLDGILNGGFHAITPVLSLKLQSVLASRLLVEKSKGVAYKSVFGRSSFNERGCYRHYLRRKCPRRDFHIMDVQTFGRGLKSGISHDSSCTFLKIVRCFGISIDWWKRQKMYGA
ncbi:hypothetical protein CEXT_292861 [Caerostris extrusa]|uniref:Uncharacterized protein n=1 Tax=Caerostris extrusa TaxID=172846 RepID=A0AAV4PBV9_CAEEX|nr:hypothetical protein CEXT_292861 [Caerostris extrusa]